MKEEDIKPIGTVPADQEPPAGTPEPAPPTSNEPTPEPAPLPEPPKPPAPDEQPPAQDNLKWFNEATGLGYESEDMVKQAAERLRKWDEVNTGYETTQKELQELKKIKEELETKVNPLSHFKDETEYIRQQLLIKHPDMDPTTLTSVVRADVDKMSNIDILKMAMRLDYPDLKATESQLNGLIEKKYDIDVSDYDPTEATGENLKIQMDVRDAIKKFNTLKQGVELPQAVDLGAQKKEQIESLSGQWKPFVEKIADKLDKVVVETTSDGKKVPLVEYDIDPEFRKEVSSKVDDIVKQQAERGVAFTPEMQDALVQGYKQYYMMANMDKIIQANTERVIADMTEAQFRELHNPSEPPNPDRKPEEGAGLSEARQRVRDDIMSTRRIN